MERKGMLLKIHGSQFSIAMKPLASQPLSCPHFILLGRSRARWELCWLSRTAPCLQLGQPWCVRDQVLYCNGILGHSPEGKDISLEEIGPLISG